jgi:predicted dienelactone hydrolase
MLLCQIMLLVAQAAGAQPFGFDTFVDQVTDTSRSRDVPYRIFYPTGFTGTAPLILVSHGGNGNYNGHLRFDHLGEEFSANGYVSLHLNHQPSSTTQIHQLDRPADVSFVLDSIEAGSLPLPPGFAGSIDVERVGHIGHSFGAYTAHAVGGADFEQGNFRDSRVDAIVPLSPQGADQFGAFDNGPTDSTWSNMAIPALNMVGGNELDTNALGIFMGENWRLRPFERYPFTQTKYLAIIPDQDHNDMGTQGSAAVQAYIAQNARLFFDVYLRGESAREPDIGTLAFFLGTEFYRQGESLPTPMPACGGLGLAGVIACVTGMLMQRR